MRSREHLPPEEVEAMRETVRKAGGRHAHRDVTLILLMYRHGLRVGEASALRWEQIDFATYNLHVQRVKWGTPSTQPLYGDEIWALRKLQRDYPQSSYVFQSSRKGPLAKDTISGIIERSGKLAKLPFPVHAHMLRHGCGYYLASENTDTRTIQAYLGASKHSAYCPLYRAFTTPLQRVMEGVEVDLAQFIGTSTYYRHTLGVQYPALRYIAKRGVLAGSLAK